MLDALLLASMLTVSVADRCAEPPRLASGIAKLRGGVLEAESFTVTEIQDMARRSGAVLPHPPLGFYKADFGHDYQVRTEKQTSPDGARCGTLTTVTVRVVLVDRSVEIARDLHERGCDRDLVARHYLKHADADDRVLSRHVRTLHQALVAAWPAIQERLPASGTPDDSALHRAIEPIVTPLLADAEKARSAALAEVDSASEVLALAAACTTRL